MELAAKQVLEVMREKGVQYLFHANTVLTSCSCLMKGALLSRGTVEQSGLPQTIQSSDDIDIKYGLWFDLFFDTFDLHEAYTKRNVYGPVLFQLDISLLDDVNMPPLWITKNNPLYWKNEDAASDRWFSSISELRASFDKWDAKHMLVLRHLGGVLPLKDRLKRIMLDDPQMKLSTGVDAFESARSAISSADHESLLKNVPIIKRRCGSPRCKCKLDYREQELVDENFGTEGRGAIAQNENNPDEHDIDDFYDSGVIDIYDTPGAWNAEELNNMDLLE